MNYHQTVNMNEECLGEGLQTIRKFLYFFCHFLLFPYWFSYLFNILISSDLSTNTHSKEPRRSIILQEQHHGIWWALHLAVQLLPTSSTRTLDIKLELFIFVTYFSTVAKWSETSKKLAKSRNIKIIVMCLYRGIM